MPITMYGDALNRVADIVLRLAKSHGGVLLVDEIENGIHHFKQKELWKKLFQLTRKFNTQIFVTSHSSEMIEAFKNTIIEENAADRAAYFEMYRSAKSGEIVAKSTAVEELAFAINNHESFRGE